MKILYIFNSLAIWGGIERILVDKMNYLVAMYDMDVYLLTTDQAAHAVPYSLDERIRIDDLNICFYHQYKYKLFRRLWFRWKKQRQFEHLLKDRINIIKPDIIICVSALLLSSLVKIKCNIPIVFESHSICSRTIEQGKWLPQRKLFRFLFLRSLLRIDVVVALTEGDAKEWRRFHSNVMVIPNVLHKHEGKTSNLLANHAIFVGRFDFQKRVQDAILIWEKVCRQIPDWYLDIYGEGAMAQTIESLASSTKNVNLHRPTDRIFDKYCESSFLISTSLFEPFGLAIIEAMSCGLPVVSFDCPYGPADIISDQIDGVLVKNRDMDEYVNNVCSLIKDVDLRQKMGRAGLVSSKRYDANVIMPIWKRLFEHLVEHNSTNRN